MTKKRIRRQKVISQVSEASSVFGQLGYGWRTQTFIPSGGRKNEQGFLNAREAFCLTPAFRRDIQELRNRYPVSYWEHVHQADRDDQDLANKWRITEPQWILWLVQNWDPGKTKSRPPLPTLSMPPSLVEQLERLCQTSAFRRDVQALRQHYPASYWAQGHQLGSEAEQFCQRWGIDGLTWVVWLIEHWDPSQDPLPPFEPSDRLPPVAPVLRNWVLTVESVVDHRITRKVGKPFRATLTLYPSVSLREVQAAAKIAIQAFASRGKRTGARPGVTDIERALVRKEFEEFDVPGPRKQTQLARNVARRMEHNGHPMGESTILKELRAWLREKGEPVKQYLTQKRDSRS